MTYTITGWTQALVTIFVVLTGLCFCQTRMQPPVLPLSHIGSKPLILLITSMRTEGS